MDTWRSGLLVALIASTFAHSFFPLPHGEYLLGIITFAVILVFLPITNGVPKFFGTSMLVIGCLILLVNGHGIHEWPHYLIRNVPLIVLITLVPVLAIPLKLGGYDQSIKAISLRYRDRPSLLFLAISAVFFVLGPIMNLGSIRLMDAMVGKLKLPVQFLGKVYVRGFTSIISWSPYLAAVLLVLNYVDISVADYLLYGIFLGIVQLAVSNALFLKEAKAMHLPVHAAKRGKISFKLVELIVIFIILTVLVFLLERVLQKSMIIVVSLSALIFPFLWSAYIRTFKVFWQELKVYSRKTVLSGSNEVVLFLTAGFFGVVLSTTSIGDFIHAGMKWIAGHSVLFLIFFTIVIISLLAACGIHQIVTVTSIASSVTAAELGLENVVFALILMSAWAVSSIVSPVTPVIVIVTNLLKRSFYEVAFKWNGAYAVMVTFVHTVYIYLFHLWLA